jgi:hypothetical protein
MTGAGNGMSDSQPPSENLTSTRRADALIREYYTCFNERRFVDAASLFTEDAELEQLPMLRQERGGIGYLQFASAWLRAFPDAVLTPQRILSRSDVAHEVTLTAAGTHRGLLELGEWAFRPTDLHAVFGIRELLEIRHGKIALSSLSFNLHEIVDTLAQVDPDKLLGHIERLRALGMELCGSRRDTVRSRDITAAIGRELDAARHVVRPYYKRPKG